jgi:voltage-gated potassium channel
MPGADLQRTDAAPRTRRRRAETQTLLDAAETRPRAAIAVELVLIATIVASVTAMVLETVDSIAGVYGSLFAVIEMLAVTVFTVEYGLRLWTAPESEGSVAPDPWRARLRYALSPLGVIDLLAILPFYPGRLLPMGSDWLRVLRLLRLLKLARYAPALPLFAAVIRNEGRPLLAGLIVMAVLLIFNSGVMFVLERDAQPKAFASIPHAMWWAIVTMGTVGYGDVVPVTPLGKLFGGFVMILGIAMFAVPAGILATGFAIELRKRDFVVTWQTVARVPLFAGLDAARIAEIARLLKREVVPAKYAVVRRGEPADAMFFIMSGEVEVDVPPTPRRMGRGQFFGEIALLRDTVRTATVTTLSECELLCLDVADFRRLVEAHPDVKTSITQVAEQRLAALGASPPTDGGGAAGSPPAS